MNSVRPPFRWDAAREAVVRPWQLRRLRHYLTRTIQPFSPFYRKRFAELGFDPRDLQTWDDWARLPLTGKRDLCSSPDAPQRARDFVLQPDGDVLRRHPAVMLRALLHGKNNLREALDAEYRPLLLTSTSGRSSEPIPFLFTRHDLGNLELQGRRIMEVGGSARDFRHVNLFPYAPHLAFWQTHYAGLGFGTFCIGTGGGKTLGTAGNIALIEKIKPNVIIGMPTFMYHLLTEAAAMGKCWKQLKIVSLGGEKVPPGLRKKLQDIVESLGSPAVKVISIYGFTEAKMAFAECPSFDGTVPTGFHLSPDLGLVEIVDPETGMRVPDGQPGEIVYTPLDDRGTVVLRYRTGDLIDGGLTWEPCPQCGRSLPRLTGAIRRVSEIRRLHMDKLKGTLVDFNALEQILDDEEGLRAWQIELRKDHDDPLECDVVLVHATAMPGVPEETLRRRIQNKLKQTLEISPDDILFHDMEQMREKLGVGRLLKEERITDKRVPNLTPS